MGWPRLSTVRRSSGSARRALSGMAWLLPDGGPFSVPGADCAADLGGFGGPLVGVLLEPATEGIGDMDWATWGGGGGKMGGAGAMACGIAIMVDVFGHGGPQGMCRRQPFAGRGVVVVVDVRRDAWHARSARARSMHPCRGVS